MKYRVKWEIDVEAEDEFQAALEALEIQRNDDNTATVFTVTEENGRAHTVDANYVSCSGDGCEQVVECGDPFYATPCGTYCEDCMEKHAKECGVCAHEFGL